MHRKLVVFFVSGFFGVLHLRVTAKLRTNMAVPDDGRTALGRSWKCFSANKNTGQLPTSRRLTLIFYISDGQHWDVHKATVGDCVGCLLRQCMVRMVVHYRRSRILATCVMRSVINVHMPTIANP